VDWEELGDTDYQDQKRSLVQPALALAAAQVPIHPTSYLESSAPLSEVASSREPEKLTDNMTIIILITPRSMHVVVLYTHPLSRLQ